MLTPPACNHSAVPPLQPLLITTVVIKIIHPIVQWTQDCVPRFHLHRLLLDRCEGKGKGKDVDSVKIVSYQTATTVYTVSK